MCCHVTVIRPSGKHITRDLAEQDVLMYTRRRRIQEPSSQRLHVAVVMNKIWRDCQCPSLCMNTARGDVLQSHFSSPSTPSPSGEPRHVPVRLHYLQGRPSPRHFPSVRIPGRDLVHTGYIHPYFFSFDFFQLETLTASMYAYLGWNTVYRPHPERVSSRRGEVLPSLSLGRSGYGVFPVQRRREPSSHRGGLPVEPHAPERV